MRLDAFCLYFAAVLLICCCFTCARHCPYVSLFLVDVAAVVAPHHLVGVLLSPHPVLPLVAVDEGDGGGPEFVQAGGGVGRVALPAPDAVAWGRGRGGKNAIG